MATGITYENKRIIVKQNSTDLDFQPEIGPSTNHTDGTWLNNNIYSGEFVVDKVKEAVFVGCENEVLKLLSTDQSFNLNLRNAVISNSIYNIINGLDNEIINSVSQITNGNNNEIRDGYGLVIGNNNLNSGYSNIVLGSDGYTDGQHNSVFGSDNDVKGNYNLINGHHNTINNVTNSIIQGNYHVVSACTNVSIIGSSRNTTGLNIRNCNRVVFLGLSAGTFSNLNDIVVIPDIQFTKNDFMNRLNSNFLSANTSYYTRVEANSNFLSANTSFYTQSQVNTLLSGASFSGVTIDSYTKIQSNSNFLSANTSFYTQSQVNTLLSGITVDAYTKVQANNNFLSANTSFYTQSQVNNNFLSANTSFYTQSQVNNNFLSANTNVNNISSDEYSLVMKGIGTDNKHYNNINLRYETFWNSVYTVYGTTVSSGLNIQGIRIGNNINTPPITFYNFLDDTLSSTSSDCTIVSENMIKNYIVGNYYNKSQVDQLISEITVSSGSTDLSNYYTKAQTNANFLSANTSYYTRVEANNNFLSANTSFYTQSQVNTLLSGITISGGTVDLTNIYFDISTSSSGTITSGTTGIIYKNNYPFLHDNKHPDASGDNVFLGRNAGLNTSSNSYVPQFGSRNIGIGLESLKFVNIGMDNVAIGVETMFAEGDGFLASNVAIGNYALRVRASFGNLMSNVAVGYAAGTNLLSGGCNTMIGSCSGIANYGSNNICIGNYAGHGIESVSNKLFIGSYSNQTLIGGDFLDKYVSIDNKLRLNGATSGYITLKATDAANTGLTFTFPNNDGSNNQVLTTDGAGNLSFTNKLALSDVNYTGVTATATGNTVSIPANELSGKTLVSISAVVVGVNGLEIHQCAKQPTQHEFSVYLYNSRFYVTNIDNNSADILSKQFRILAFYK